jgi:transcriptional regulator with PAS, ATPase and Fis domain
MISESERRKVLSILYEHKINVDEAEGLLDALEHAPEPAPELKVEYITANPKMQKVLDDAQKIASSSSPVLIIGETGTGKELVARLIHQTSPRWDKMFVAVNCCVAIPETLLEAETFGYMRGAFTGAIYDKPGRIELTDGGTLFLDAIDELTMPFQGNLLLFIETGEFVRIGGTRSTPADVRLIAATNKDLRAEVQAGRFREDLFYRLSAMSLQLPPLRERVEDFPLLVDYFLKKYARRDNRAITGIAKEAMDVLMAYAWPGNVRELASVIERALGLCNREMIQVEHLPDALTNR